MTIRQRSLLVGGFALLACVAAVVPLGLLEADWQAAWKIIVVPSLFVLLGLAGAAVQSRTLMFGATAALWTFVVLGLWSVGLVFAPAAFVLTIAAALALGSDPIGDATSIRLLMSAFLGVTGLCAGIVLRAKSNHTAELPFIFLAGAFAFPVLLGVLRFWELRRWFRRSER
jgi:hypothetical protein